MSKMSDLDIEKMNTEAIKEYNSVRLIAINETMMILDKVLHIFIDKGLMPPELAKAFKKMFEEQQVVVDEIVKDSVKEDLN